MRSPLGMVQTLLEKGRKPDQILSVALAVRNGLWYDSVKEILEQKKLLGNTKKK